MSIDFEKYKALTQQLDDYTDIYTDLHPPILYDAVDAINELLDYIKSCDSHIKIQYHNEELTVQEICERLERAEKIISDMGYNVQHINYPPQKGLTVWYIDDSGEPEKGTVFSVEIKNGILDSFSVDFEDDFDEFNGSAWGKYVFDNPDGK